MANLFLEAKDGSSFKQPTTVLSVDEIYPHAPVESEWFQVRLAESIKEYGMEYPIVVWRVTVKRWKEICEHNKDMIPPPETTNEHVYQIRCGHNRWRIAKELGYKYIECIVVHDLKDSNDLCYRQRAKQAEWINTNQHGNWLR